MCVRKFNSLCKLYKSSELNPIEEPQVKSFYCMFYDD